MKYTHKFDPPFEHGGKTYEEMVFDFDSLDGTAMVNVEQEAKALGEGHLVAEFDKAYQYRLAAKAAGVSSDMILAMPLRDFNRITNRTRSFLIGLASLLQDKETEATEETVPPDEE
ncbi:MAG: phage tail assembly protein [Oscillospiraceae bacterium]|nr:phage tail assembly protein [Oscillospiraceae bacterium]